MEDSGHPDVWEKRCPDVKWEGRMEEVLPDVYVDGAHNFSAVEAFAESVPPDVKGQSDSVFRGEGQGL